MPFPSRPLSLIPSPFFLFLNVFAFAEPASYISCQSPPLFKLKALFIIFISISRAEQNMRIRVFLLPSSMPLTVHLCLLVTSALLLFLCSARSCLGDCLYNPRCGDVEFSYPFVNKDNSGCGESDFQFECEEPDDHNGLPLLDIDPYKYRLLTTGSVGEHGSHNLTIVFDWRQNNNLCNSAHNNPSLWHDSEFFHIADGYTNVTFWIGCNEEEIEGHGFNVLNYPQECEVKWTYSEDSGLYSRGSEYCQMHFQLPIPNVHPPLNNIDGLLQMGFNITWYYDPSNGKKATNGVTIGVSVGAAVLLSAAGLLVGITLYAKRRRKAASRCSVSKVEEFLKEYADQMPTRYSLSQIKKITNNFAEKLGEGGFGVVYKGKLRNGTLVAVKLLDRHRQGESTDFMNEVATIGRLHHVNLVRLLGYCFESFTSALVYEFMANGSLEKFIFAGKEKGRLLTWENLYSIALGAARGIAYLHQDCEKRIIHFDIKPHNILLDADFTPKVSDFGLAKLCRKGDDHISMTATRRTPGYVAPEVFDRTLGPATDKSDVYSFGMLLLEIVGERKNFDSKVSHSSQFYFPEWAFKLLERGELGMRLRGGEVEAEDEEKARRMTKVGLWCIQYNYNDRPSMSSVVQMLQENGGEVANPPLPSNPHSASPENPLLSSAEESSSIEIRS
eukprot:PITA_35175